MDAADDANVQPATTALGDATRSATEGPRASCSSRLDARERTRTQGAPAPEAFRDDDGKRIEPDDPGDSSVNGARSTRSNAIGHVCLRPPRRHLRDTSRVSGALRRRRKHPSPVSGDGSPEAEDLARADRYVLAQRLREAIDILGRHRRLFGTQLFGQHFAPLDAGGVVLDAQLLPGAAVGGKVGFERLECGDVLE